MASLFTRIIRGELPGRFVWKDDRCVAFLTIAPLAPGHTLVVPRDEIDHWIDLPQDLATHLTEVAQAVGKGIQQAFQPVKVGMMIAGLEVPHVHLHLVPIRTLQDMNFANQDRNPNPADLDAAAERLRSTLRSLGYKQVSD
ncbi:HIT family protein [Vulgatibacter incomptus]|uniref:HIT family protein n=1 Tax=Vulgatibacter incomptus TaxID=1391653 RepID=A0A0K1PG64_9BACT|nr:HIT family protein [Vulgatibacter incomptus]AKU92497.1 HIT family protein [Vulgatibacter incomptus]